LAEIFQLQADDMMLTLFLLQLKYFSQFELLFVHQPLDYSRDEFEDQFLENKRKLDEQFLSFVQKYSLIYEYDAEKTEQIIDIFWKFNIAGFSWDKFSKDCDKTALITTKFSPKLWIMHQQNQLVNQYEIKYFIIVDRHGRANFQVVYYDNNEKKQVNIEPVRRHRIILPMTFFCAIKYQNPEENQKNTHYRQCLPFGNLVSIVFTTDDDENFKLTLFFLYQNRYYQSSSSDLKKYQKFIKIIDLGLAIINPFSKKMFPDIEDKNK
jgi:hypothetical protein